MSTCRAKPTARHRGTARMPNAFAPLETSVPISAAVSRAAAVSGCIVWPVPPGMRRERWILRTWSALRAGCVLGVRRIGRVGRTLHARQVRLVLRIVRDLIGDQPRADQGQRDRMSSPNHFYVPFREMFPHSPRPPRVTPHASPQHLVGFPRIIPRQLDSAALPPPLATPPQPPAWSESFTSSIIAAPVAGSHLRLICPHHTA